MLKDVESHWPKHHPLRILKLGSYMPHLGFTSFPERAKGVIMRLALWFATALRSVQLQK